MAYMVDILHWPLHLLLNQGEIPHGIKYRMQFKKPRCIYDAEDEADNWVDNDKVIKMFSQLLESLKEC